MKLRPPRTAGVARLHRPRRRSVADQVRQQAAEAAQIASITGQGRLDNPRTHPRVRGLLDRLRVRQQRSLLRAEHQRALRRVRVTVRRSADAEQTLRVLHKAKDVDSPARSLLALYRGRTVFLAVTMTVSLLLGVGAATGLAKLAARLGAHPYAGWIAELGLTGLATVVILSRSHLARHGRQVTGWQNWLLWGFTVAPLAVSVAGNIIAAGVIGMACSIGAVAFSVLSHVIADQYALAMHTQAQRVTAVDEEQLHALAVGDDDVFQAAPPAPEPAPALAADPREVSRVQADLAHRGVDLPPEVIAQHLPADPIARTMVPQGTMRHPALPRPARTSPAPASPVEGNRPGSGQEPAQRNQEENRQNHRNQGNPDQQNQGDQGNRGNRERSTEPDHPAAAAAAEPADQAASGEEQQDHTDRIRQIAAAHPHIPMAAIKAAVRLDAQGIRITRRLLADAGVKGKTTRLNAFARELREATGQEDAQLEAV